MAEESQKTPPEETPTGTDGAQAPAATHSQAASEAVTGDGEMVTLSKKDHAELVSQRDRNHERARVVEQKVIEDMQKEDIQKFLADPENKKKFPDVTVDDLMVANDPEEFAEISGQTQARIDSAVQTRLGDIERASDPVLSPEERAEQEKKLKNNPGSSSLESMIELRSRPS